jgi:Ca2+-binding RTX toxin-like protein
MGIWTPGAGPTAGDDVFVGDATSEIASGGAGNDTLNGGAGDDTLDGDSGTDTLNGGAGADTLRGGLGNDTLTGGEGADIFFTGAYYDPTGQGSPNVDTITDLGLGADVIQASGNSFTSNYYSQAVLNATVVADWIATSATYNSFSTVNLSSNGFAVDLSAVTSGNSGFAVTNTGAATQFIGSRFNDQLTGGTGDDTLTGGGGYDTLTGGAGRDTFNVDARGSATITDFGNGNDVLRTSIGIGPHPLLSINSRVDGREPDIGIPGTHQLDVVD